MKKNLPKMLTLLRRMLLLLAWMCMAALAVFYLYSYRGFVVDDMRFEREICQAAQKYDLDPLLVRALIYEESRFNPARVGNAGEIGLMQIMPSLAAADWAKANKRKRPMREMLFSPELNLDIGCWYLRDSLNKFKDYDHALELALARYNAGLSRARRWTPAEKKAPVLDNITIPSTRKYVSNIMERSARYQSEKNKEIL